MIAPIALVKRLIVFVFFANVVACPALISCLEAQEGEVHMTIRKSCENTFEVAVFNRLGRTVVLAPDKTGRVLMERFAVELETEGRVDVYNYRESVSSGIVGLGMFVLPGSFSTKAVDLSDQGWRIPDEMLSNWNKIRFVYNPPGDRLNDDHPGTVKQQIGTSWFSRESLDEQYLYRHERLSGGADNTDDEPD